MGSAARASARWAGCTAQTTTNTPSASAAKNRPSAAIEKATATSTPRITPSRSQCPGRRSANSRQTSSGTSHPAVQFRWALACETMPGEKAMNRPPTPAASWLRTRCRESSQYQASAVANRFRVRITRNVAGGPIRYVSGAKTTAYTVIEVLTARLTPSGTLIRYVKNGFSPWRDRVRAEGQQPLEERLVAGVDGDGAHVRVPPQAAGHPDGERERHQHDDQVGPAVPEGARR